MADKVVPMVLYYLIITSDIIKLTILFNIKETIQYYS